MKIKKVNYKNEESLIVYLSRFESEDDNIKQKILGYRTVYSNIAVFISGDNDTFQVLNEIIKAYR